MPWLTRSLVLVNAGVFLLTSGNLLAAAMDYGAVAAHFTGLTPEAVRIPRGDGGWDRFPTPPAEHLLLRTVAHMFVHGSLLHVLANLWFLWIFGDNVEDRLGRLRYLALYFGSGLAALAAQIAAHPAAGVPMVGASGAIAGVLGAYAVAFPHSRVVTLVPIGFIPVFVHLPARFFLLVWFAIQLVSGFGSPAGGGVAWWAHVGGFVAGMLLLRVLTPRPRRQVRVEIKLDD